MTQTPDAETNHGLARRYLEPTGKKPLSFQYSFAGMHDELDAEQLALRTQHLLSADGALGQLHVLTKQLNALVIAAVDAGAPPHRSDISPQDCKGLLIGHYGINGNYANGVAGMYQLFTDPEVIRLVPRHAKAPAAEKAAHIIKAFREKSQFSVSQDYREVAVTVGAIMLDEAGNITHEDTKMEALARGADEMLRWAHANTAHVSPETVQGIENKVKHYHEALGAIADYVNYAERYLSTPTLSVQERGLQGVAKSPKPLEKS